MKKIGKTFIVLLISFVVWFAVNVLTEGFGLDLNDTTGPIVLFSVPIIISIIYYRDYSEPYDRDPYYRDPCYRDYRDPYYRIIKCWWDHKIMSTRICHNCFV